LHGTVGEMHAVMCRVGANGGTAPGIYGRGASKE